MAEDDRLDRTGAQADPHDWTSRPAGSGSRWSVAPNSVAGDYKAEVRSPRRAAPEVVEPAAPAWESSSLRRDPVDDGIDEPEPVPRRASRSKVDDEVPPARELREATQLGTRPNTVLAGFGGVILIIVTTGIGATLDILVSSTIGLGALIGVCVGAFAAALLTRKSDLLSVIVAPPIVYTVFVALSLLLKSAPVTLTSLANSAVSGFPAIALSTGIAALIAGIKLVTSRPHERP